MHAGYTEREWSGELAAHTAFWSSRLTNELQRRKEDRELETQFKAAETQLSLVGCGAQVVPGVGSCPGASRSTREAPFLGGGKYRQAGLSGTCGDQGCNREGWVSQG